MDGSDRGGRRGGARSGGRAISPVVQGSRILRLRKQHRALIAKLRHKRSAISRLREEATQVGGELALRSSSLQAQQRCQDEQLHADFAAIANDLSFSRDERGVLRSLYQGLKDANAISAISARSAGPVVRAEAAQELATAPAPGAASLRRTFLRLARTYHPDTAADGVIHERHTEVMKQVNLAYRGGDSARLLELERALDDGAAIAEELDAVELSAQVDALRTQLRALSERMRQLRSELGAVMALESRRLVRAGHGDPVSVLVEQLGAVVAQSQRLCELVGRFREREIDLDALLEGPSAQSTADRSWLDEVFTRTRRLRVRR